VKQYQSVTEHKPLHNTCTTYQLCFRFYGICYSLLLTEAYHKHAAVRFELYSFEDSFAIDDNVLQLGNEYLCQKHMPSNGYFSHGQL